ncbi:ATP-grasp domain-containing protein [Micromonospora sp. CPCC 205546]|uniref:ATP-grasp domain-containing protein n=1 Tax=Micromonospora sp. CPCC 205546 TaxID=3122397 RepID=UPI002FF0B3A7
MRELLAKFRTPKLDHHRRVVVIQGDEPEDLVVDLVSRIHAVDPFDAVACLGEPLTMLASRMAAAFGLPGVPRPEVTELIVDKEAMRVRLIEAGVEEIRGRTVDSAEELADVVRAGAAGATWIVKPVAGAGSLGVSQVTAESDLAAAFERSSNQDSVIHPDRHKLRVLVEPFLFGPQFSVEAVTQDGVTTVLAITKKYSDPDTMVEFGHVVPAPLSEDDSEAIHAHVVKVLQALGVTDSVTHTEVVLTADGPRILETHTRMGGDDIGEMASLVSGVDISAASIELVLGESVHDRLANAKPSGKCEAIWFVASPEAGIFAGLDGVRAAQALDPSIQVTELIEVGEPVELLASSDSRVAQVRASASSADEAVALARQAAAKLTLRIARGVPAEVGATKTV